ncbi:hypothetical protein QBC35DRAFT_489189 [Podospora australis]|uniref:Uncharacterized protein n=1 Tax=Podospora australis TaxID=1536484 RepID=A0AAN6WZ41_9PEZI|nr:hypothetical protein QBC35DRAFT_489189 [Podospora australis]
MAQGKIQGSRLHEVLMLTSRSRAFDLRDRVFGVLGLIEPPRFSQEAVLRPNYSLSTQQVFVGFFAHLVLQDMHFLFHAMGAAASDSRLSWAPAWETDEDWQQLLEAYPKKPKRLDELMPPTLRSWLDDERDPAQFVDGDLGECLEGPYRSRFWDLESKSEGYRSSYLQALPWQTLLLKNPDQITINSNTGALSLELIYWCIIPYKPVGVCRDGSWGTFEIRGPGASMYLISTNPLDSCVSPGEDYIFIIKNLGVLYTYLVVRKCSQSGTWRIVATCRNAFMHTRKLVSVPSASEILVRNALQELVPELVYDRLGRQIPCLRQLIPSARYGWDVFPAYAAMISTQAEEREPFESVYLSYFGLNYEGKIVVDDDGDTAVDCWMGRARSRVKMKRVRESIASHFSGVDKLRTSLNLSIDELKAKLEGRRGHGCLEWPEMKEWKMDLRYERVTIR